MMGAQPPAGNIFTPEQQQALYQQMMWQQQLIMQQQLMMQQHIASQGGNPAQLQS